MEITELERGLSKRIPGYAEIRKLISDTAFDHNPKPRIWLDTGCGTGVLVRDLLSRFGSTQFVLADPSDDNISECKSQMRGEQRCLYVTQPTDKLNFGESLDVITAVLCHHYYRTKDERKIALANCFRMLKRSGLFFMVEHARFPDQDKKDSEWREFMRSNAMPDQFIERMIERRGTEYFPLTQEEHIVLLEEVGFKNINVFWLSCSDIGIFAEKI